MHNKNAEFFRIFCHFSHLKNVRKYGNMLITKEKGVLKMSKFYLAYGSNLNIRQMKIRCPNAEPVGTAVINGYGLLFKGSKTGAYLTIEKAGNSTVPVAVWKVSESDELRLDAYEGYPNFYYKTEMELPVKMLKNGIIKTITAFVYIMHENRHLGKPSIHYVRTCAEGYRNFGFDKEFLEMALKKSLKGCKK